MCLLDKQDEQLGKIITDKAKEIYSFYHKKEITDDTANTIEYLSILKGIMAGMLI